MKARLEVVTIFPDLVSSFLDSAMLRRAQLKGRVELGAIDLRAFAPDKYKSVDDTPFGGGQGMLYRADILESAVKSLKTEKPQNHKVFLTSPKGVTLRQGLIQNWSEWLLADEGRKISVFCGRYEGVDERFVDQYVDMEFSLGDFIMTGGELPALALVDALVRLIPGVLGDQNSAVEDSFAHGLLEHPQYTRPRIWNDQEVPEVLLGGHHKNIEEWKLKESLMQSFAFRPDLIASHTGEALPPWAHALLKKLQDRLALRT